MADDNETAHPGVPLWSILLGDDAGAVRVYPRDGRTFVLRVEVYSPGQFHPVVVDKVVTRERLRKLWLAVRGEVPASL